MTYMTATVRLEDGTIYGIELLNANEQLRHEDTGRFLIINEATGERAELSLAIG